MSSSVLIADDHPMCAAALAMAVASVEPGAHVVRVESISAAETAARRQSFDLVLLDLMLPDVQGMAGLLMLRQLRPGAVFAIVSSRDEPAVMRLAAEHGARGYLPKSAPIEDMVAAVRILLAGGQWWPDGIFDQSKDPSGNGMAARFAELSGAQLRVLLAVGEGRINKQIAHDLGIAEPTVKSHLAAIFRKLGVANRTQAVIALQSLDVTFAP